jgi:NAD(P)-dependent dehydrogenase (short-subunit alcohol dehydrogenase family)
MNIVVIGGNGTIGKAVVAALRPRHEVIVASRKSGLDLRDEASIEKLFSAHKHLDAVVSCAGSGVWKPLEQLTSADFEQTLRYKLMGQVNLARIAARHLRDGGSITLTSGVLAREPMQGGAAFSLANAGVEGFAVGASIEFPRSIRVNVVSPPWIAETLAEMKMDPAQGQTAASCARAYVAAVEGAMTGQTLDSRKF